MKHTPYFLTMLVSCSLLFCTFAATAQFVIPLNKTYGGNDSDSFRKVINTEDGGYLLAGSSRSPASGDKSEDNEPTDEHEQYVADVDVWLIKVDANGKKQWDKTYGFDQEEQVRYIIATPDGGYLLGGDSEVEPGPGPGGQNILDAFAVKLDKDGNVQWHKIYGGGDLDDLSTIIAANNGGYLLFGSSNSYGYGSDRSDYDFWVIKIDEDGNMLWDKKLGGANDDELTDAVATEDGSYLLVGSSDSDASGDKSEDSKDSIFYFSHDFWVVKIDEDGNKLWDKTLGGNNDERVRSVVITEDGGYLLVGFSRSPTSTYKSDNWLVRIDENGNKLWDKVISDENSYLSSGILSFDGNYLLAGNIASGEDKREGRVVKINDDGDILWEQTISNQNSGGFSDIIHTTDGGYLLGGNLRHAENNNDYWIVKIMETAEEFSIKNLALFNADTDEVLYYLQDRDLIHLAALGNPQLTVKANTEPINVDSVKLELTGPVSNTQLERHYPYALFGDEPDGPRDYIGELWKPGQYTLTATPYLGGNASPPITISFQVVDNPAVTSFSLINADTDSDIATLKDGDIIDLDALGNPQLSVRANTKPVNLDWVKLELSGPMNHTQTEQNYPYALFGDNSSSSGRDIAGQSWQPGQYTLKATPVLNGITGTALMITFTVQQGNTAPQAMSVEVYPVPTTGRINIVHEGTAKAARLLLLDFTGHVLLTQPLNKPVEQLDLSAYKKGLYYLKIINKEAVETRRLVIE